MKRYQNVFSQILLLTILYLLPIITFAANFPADIEKTEVSGKIRLYDFTRNYTNPFLPQQTAFALGGNINILTPDIFLTGFKVDADFYTAQNLGLNNRNSNLIDKTLGQSITVLSQAFLQYQYKNTFLIKAGRQLIDTPWINPSDSRMIPNSYEGVFVKYSPVKDINLEGLRILRFKNRMANSFDDINLYNPEASGDPIAKLRDVRDSGALGLGAHYKDKNSSSSLWYYQFYDFTKLLYGDAEYDFPALYHIAPFVGAQGLRETADGKNYILKTTGFSPYSTAYGLMGGVKNNYFKISAAYNQILEKNSSFRNGDVISPYTSSYATDPLYTTSMIAGLIEKGQGQALKTSASIFLLDKKLTLTGSYAKYFVTQSNDTEEIDADAKYAFDGKLKGFSIRDRLGVLYNDPKYQRFIYNRIMLEYEF